MDMDRQRTREADQKIKRQDPEAIRAMEQVDHRIFAEYSESYRDNILSKIKLNIRYDIAWEHLGDVYCGRRRFYAFRKEYLIAVARELYQSERGSEI